MALCILASEKIIRAPGADLNAEMNHVKPECKDEIRERILRAALVEFSQCGFDAASLNTIAANADITKQLIRYYYGSKESLYKAVLESVSGSMRIVDGVEFFENISPTAAIRALVEKMFDEYLLNPSYAMLTLDQSLHHGSHITEKSQFIPNMRFVIERIVAPIIRRGITSGEFRQTLNPGMVCWIIFHTVTACFLNGSVLSQVSGVDLASDAGIKLWRSSAVNFILRAMRPASAGDSIAFE